MDRFKAWLNQPFDPGMSVFHWWLFLGMVIVLLSLWGILMRHITEGID